jgi:hypothetical protein
MVGYVKWLANQDYHGTVLDVTSKPIQRMMKKKSLNFFPSPRESSNVLSLHWSFKFLRTSDLIQDLFFSFFQISTKRKCDVKSRLVRA